MISNLIENELFTHNHTLEDSVFSNSLSHMDKQHLSNFDMENTMNKDFYHQFQKLYSERF